MIRLWLVNPVLVIVSLAAGLCLAHAGMLKITPAQLLCAAATALASAEASVIPLLLTRGADQGAVSQAGLVSTVIHMMGCAGAALAVASCLHYGPTYFYAVLAFYWVSLLGVSMNAIRSIREAPLSRTPAAPL